MAMRLPAPGPALAGFLALAAPPVGADIYTFVDENGVRHISNIPDDPRYRLIMRTTPEAAPPARGGGQRRWRPQDFATAIDRVAAGLELDPLLLHAVIHTESSYNPRAVSSAGAVGLMQLMPGTAARYGVGDRYDPNANIRGGAHYLKDLITEFGQMHLALAAYNAGEGAVRRYGNTVPPYRETRNYVTKVLRRYHQLRAQGGAP